MLLIVKVAGNTIFPAEMKDELLPAKNDTDPKSLIRAFNPTEKSKARGIKNQTNLAQPDSVGRIFPLKWKQKPNSQDKKNCFQDP